MEIKNLAQLKRAVQGGAPFKIVKHYVRPEYEGQVRKANMAFSTGFYSVILGDPDHPVSKGNGGKGSWFGYGKASDWVFEDGLCKAFDHRDGGNLRPVWEIQFV